jgi:hypothetical protein
MDPYMEAIGSWGSASVLDEVAYSETVFENMSLTGLTKIVWEGREFVFAMLHFEALLLHCYIRNELSNIYIYICNLPNDDVSNSDYKASNYSMFVNTKLGRTWKGSFNLMGWDWVYLVLRPQFGLLYKPLDDIWGWLWSNRWNANWQGKRKYSEKTYPSVTLSTTNPTWPDQGSNLGRRGGKPASNPAWAMARPIF